MRLLIKLFAIIITIFLSIKPLEAAVALTFPRFLGFNNNNKVLISDKNPGGISAPQSTFADPGVHTHNPEPDRGEEAIISLNHSNHAKPIQDARKEENPLRGNLIGGMPGLNNKVNPRHFGAKGDGVSDDTAALNAAAAACPEGGVIYLPPGTYKTAGWLITKSLSIVSDAPLAFGTLRGTSLKAAGPQDYVLKLQGAFGDGSGSSFLHPYLRNINIDGDGQTIKDAAFSMEFCHLARVEGCSFQNTNGCGVRLRTVWELRLRDFFVLNCGTINTGSAFYIDGPKPFTAAHGCNDISIFGGVWSSNRGRWLDVSALANLDSCWIGNNKFELDRPLTPNTSSADVLHFEALSRTMIVDNTFTGFGLSSGNYANLIYINGDPTSNYGVGGSVVRGNKAAAYMGNGAIKGLYLDVNAATCEESDNTFISNDITGCPNFNVSQFPQFINRSWRNLSTSLFLLNPLPDRMLPGFLSIHKVQRGTYAKPFVPDSDCINNSQTVLKLSAANRGNGDICAQFDLGQWVGYNATNLLVRMRAKLEAEGSATITANPVSPGWNPVSIKVNSTSWAWYTFNVPIANLSTTNHKLDVYFWQGHVPLYVDGFEFSTS